MSKQREVHRGLGLTTPLTTGKDVEALQRSLNKAYKHFNIDRSIRVDGEFGPATMSAAREIGHLMGAIGKNRKRLKMGRVTRSCQRLIRGRDKTKREAVATAARRRSRKKIRKRYNKSGGQLALIEAKKQIGVTEQPDGSNWGGMVQKFIEFTGYSGPVYWCGCFACWCVVKFGGAAIEMRIRLGFNLYIVSDALAHKNGLVAVGFSEARAGDIVTYNFPHIEVVDHVEGDTIYTVGGNTSPQGGSGSQSNGGGVYPRQRSRSEVSIIARPNYR